MPELYDPRLVKATREDDYLAARRLASAWHGGRDHNITGMSHGREWGTQGLLDELEALLGQNHPTGVRSEEARLELEALKAFAEAHTSIHAVQSGHGHQFVSEDGDTMGCLSCGGKWEQVHDHASDPHHGRYRTWNGDDPTECPGVIDAEHGETRAQDAPFCNCLLCTG